jgi:peptidoglycan/xylan/chitin deacetylase (PgdA/CDA1 family)
MGRLDGDADSGHVRRCLELGVAALNECRADLAVSLLGLVARLTPDSAENTCLAGKAYLLDGRPRLAEPWFRQSLDNDPTYEDARSGLRKAAFLQDRTDEVDQALAAEGCRVPVWFRLRDPDAGSLAVTIDDGPTPDTTPALLALLDRHGVKATFFVAGIRAAAHPDVLRDMVAAGHGVHGHGWTHRAFTALSEDEMIEELSLTERVLAKFRPTPRRPWVRLPYGIGWDSPAVHRALAAWHPACRIAQWGAATGEWPIAEAHPEDGKAFDTACDQAVRHLLSRPDSLAGGILLAHDKMIGVECPTAGLAGPRMLDALLAAVLRSGLRPGPLPE